MTMEMQVVRADDDLTHLSLAGRLDIAGVDSIEEEFMKVAAERGKPLLLDFSQVNFLTSMGLRMLLSAAKILEKEQVPMVIFRPDAKVAKVLRIGGLDQFFELEQEEEAALARLQT